MSEEQSITLATAPAISAGEVSLTKEGAALIENTLATSGMIGRVAAVEENDRSVASQIDIKKLLKDMEDLRVELTKPSLEHQRKIKAVFDEAAKPLRDELSRLMKLSGDYVQLQDAKRRAEENARKEELTRLEKEREQAMSQAQSHEEREAVQAHYNDRAAVEAAVVPAPVPVAAKGQQAKPDWEIEIVDIYQFCRVFPSCVKIEPKISEIKALLRAGTVMSEAQGIRVKPILNVGVRLPPTKGAIEV